MPTVPRLPADRRRTALGTLATSVLLVIADPTRAALDLPGWRDTRWGMSRSDLEAVLGDRAFVLPGRWRYGRGYADLAVRDLSFVGLDFTAYLQMHPRTDVLRQVLLETQRQRANSLSYAAILGGLQERFGEPGRSCVAPSRAGTPRIVTVSWDFLSTTVHATFMDFHTVSVIHTNPSVVEDPLASWLERRRIRHRFLPRRLTVRFHQRGDAGLDIGEHCRPLQPPERSDDK